jgi:anti-sigma regulatory factor (Ser/Thr protein kinase)
MEITPIYSVSLPVSDASIVGEARRNADALAEQLGLDRTTRDNLSVVVVEAVKNLLKHAGQGELVLQRSWGGDLDVLALDKGPGMADPGRCMQDGFSTAGTAGIGLGAMSRLSSKFEMFSYPGRGTAALCRFSPPARAAPAAARRGILAGGGGGGEPPANPDVGVVSVPKRGERVCGDGWACVGGPDRTMVMVVDGLGHGPVAADAAREAERVFVANAHLSPEAILPIMHDALRKTRGAAVTLAELDRGRRSIRYAGVGNVAGVVVAPDGSQKSMVSHNGTVGFEMRRTQGFDYAWPLHSNVIIYSDGLTSQLKVDQYNGLLNRHPTLVAGVIYRDCSRQRDDATIVVVR